MIIRITKKDKNASRSILDRNAAIRQIDAALMRLSDIEWDVSSGSGAVSWWIEVSPPVARMIPDGLVSDSDLEELGRIFGDDLVVRGSVRIAPEQRSAVLRRLDSLLEAAP